MSHKLLALAALLAFTACAATTTAGTGNASRAAPAMVAEQDTGAGTPALPRNGKGNPDVVCYFERPTGSNIPEKVCRTKTQSEKDRERAQDMVRTAPNLNLRPGN